MRQIRLVDGSFSTGKSATLASENLGLGPKYFEWTRNDDQTGVTFFTDICLEQAIEDRSPKKVAWLIEPSEISDKHIKFAQDHRIFFDYVLTWDKSLISYAYNNQWLFYPFGGSWIKNWNIYSKSWLVSGIFSDKTKTVGHKLRHEIASTFHNKMDLYGTGYVPIPNKTLGLSNYYYSIVVENVKHDYWFTEKLIDCFSCGTIPIYWGCPSIDEFFYPDGIIQFNTVKELSSILENLSIDDYKKRLPAIEDNFELAKQYRCTEDWIYKQYPFLFEL